MDVFGWTKDCWTIFNGIVKVLDEDLFYNYTTLDIAEQPVLHHSVGAVDRKGDCGRLYLALFNFFRIADDKPNEDSETSTARGNKQMPLHRAARAGHPLIIDQLFNVGPNANATDNFGRTVLCLAAHNGNSEMVKILCDNMTPTGRDRTDSNARNALHYAVLNHNEEAAFSLIERGIDINVLDHLGRPPVLYAAMNDMGRVAKLLQPIAVFFEDPVCQMVLENLVKRAQVDREKLLGEQKGVLDPDVDMKAPSATATANN